MPQAELRVHCSKNVIKAATRLRILCHRGCAQLWCVCQPRYQHPQEAMLFRVLSCLPRVFCTCFDQAFECARVAQQPFVDRKAAQRASRGSHEGAQLRQVLSWVLLGR